MNIQKSKTAFKKIRKPALDFDRDKNQTYRPQDESINPSVVYPADVESDIERVTSEDNSIWTQTDEINRVGVEETKGNYISEELIHPSDASEFQTDNLPSKKNKRR